jgi:hypothetical protein
MSAPLPAELHEERLQEAVDAARARTYDRIGRQPLTWLALVPEWTLELAQMCDFPADIAEFTQRAREAGLCEIRRRRGVPASFWMTATAREDFLRDARAHGRTELAEIAGEIGERIVAVEGKVRVAPSIRHWAEIARLGAAGALRGGDELGRRIQETTGRRDAAAALDWIAAGEGLASVLGGDIGAVVARGRRRVNLEYRRRHDERALEHFLRRDEQVELLRRLILESGPAWALHFIGMGGVGKTMLMRYVGTGFAADHGSSGFPVGRVDFDHIDPRYPWERPEQLLVELADALSAYVETADQEAALDAFIELVRRSDEARGSSSGLAQLGESPFLAALEGFARFAETLPQPVVLVLDTCEELAKLHPGDASVPSVDATFTILEHLHEALPTVRVVLAGRRLLATAGAGGWTVDNVQPASLTSLQPRPYLMLHEVRGFDRDEAEELFRMRDLRVPRDAFEVVLGASLETGRVPGVPGGREGVAGDRYNPFDLDLYADWLAEEGELPLTQIASGDSDAYVRLRIAERLNEPGLERALPGAALLGRFDLATIAPLLPGDAFEHERLMRAFAEQEWIDIVAGDEPESMVLEIEPHLLPRLRAYYANTPEQDEAVETLSRHLEHLLLAEDLGALAIQHADTVLQLYDPADAARLWERLELRIAAEARWDWALSACLRLLAVDEDTGERRHVPLRAAIRASYQAARRHHPAEYGPDPEGWREVLAEAENHPVAEIREQLLHRARLGAWGDAAESGESLEAPDGVRWRQLLRRPVKSEQLAASVVAALERVMDSTVAEEAVERISHEAIVVWAAEVHARCPAELRGAAETLAARATVLAGALYGSADWPESRSGVDGHRQRFVDWVAPASPTSREQLERLLLWSSRWQAPWAAGPGQAPPGRETVDDARLTAACVVAALAFQADSELVLLMGDTPEPGREPAPECGAHRRVPPLFVARARALVAIGRGQEALDLLRRHEETATAKRGADEAQRAAASDARLEMLAVLRRMRVSGPYVQVLRSPVQPPGAGGTFAQREIGAVAAALVLDETAGEFQPGSPLASHLAWRAAGPPPQQRDLTRAARDNDPVLTAHLSLDRCEARLLQGGDRFTGLEPGELVELWAGARDRERRGLAAVPPFEGEWVRILLRGWGLSTAHSRPLNKQLLPLPGRRLAELALEEGELLALRHPARALPLLEMATAGYAVAGDQLGELLARIVAALAAFRADLDDIGRRNVAMSRDLYVRIAQRFGLPGWEAARPVGDIWDGWLLRLQVAQAWAAGRAGPESGPAEVRRGGGNYIDSAPLSRRPPATMPTPAVSEPTAPAAAVPRLPAPGTAPDAQPLAPADGGIVCPSCGAVSAPGARFCETCGMYLDWQSDEGGDWLSRWKTQLAAPQSAAESPRPRASVSPRRRRSIWPPLLAAAVLGIAAIVTVVALGGESQPTASPSGGSAGGNLIAVAVLVLAALAALALLARATANSLTHRAFRTWRCVIHPLTSSAGPAASVEAQARGRSRTWILQVAWTELANPRLPQLQHFLRRRRSPLPLVVTAELAESGWEAALLLAPGSGGLPRAEAWRFTPQRQWSNVPRIEPVVLGLAPERWLLLVENMWVGRARLPDSEANHPLAAGGIVHLIGVPALTPTGWRLRLDDARLAQPEAGVVTRSTEDAEQLIAPEAIANPSGRGLAIVQGSPGPPSAETAAGLRGFAAALFDAGVPSVLTIPQLPVDLVGTVCGAFATALPQHANAPDDLLKATRALRSAIVRELGGGPQAVSVAMDVCLYAPERQ